jgi:hypothetical protein
MSEINIPRYAQCFLPTMALFHFIVNMTGVLPCRSSEAYVSFRCSNPIAFNYPLRSLVLGMKVSARERVFLLSRSSPEVCESTACTLISFHYSAGILWQHTQPCVSVRADAGAGGVQGDVHPHQPRGDHVRAAPGRSLCLPFQL